MANEREIGNRVKSGIIGVIRGTGEIAQATIETVAETAQAAVKGAGVTGAAVTGLAVGAVKGALQSGAFDSVGWKRTRGVQPRQIVEAWRLGLQSGAFGLRSFRRVLGWMGPPL